MSGLAENVPCTNAVTISNNCIGYVRVATGLQERIGLISGLLISDILLI